MEARDKSEQEAPAASRAMLGAKYVSIERRSPGDTVFLVDDTPFRSGMPQPTHWSIAWSDLMMTMFVLFLSLFVYKTANEDFLNPERMEVIAGGTAPAVEEDSFDENGMPITPIDPAPPLIAGGTVNKTEAITLQVSPPGERFPTIKEPPPPVREIIEVPVEERFAQVPEILTAPPAASEQPDRPAVSGGGSLPVQPRERPTSAVGTGPSLLESFRLSKQAMEIYGLQQFATTELIGDSVLRLTLASDILFPISEAGLTSDGREKLGNLATAIEDTPYVIHVVGHTDNIPVISDKFASNWDLSSSQASSVARYLLTETSITPQQITVTGYSSYRPRVPNSSAENRKINRRVEIIISRKLPRKEF